MVTGAMFVPGAAAWAGKVSEGDTLLSQHRLATALESFREAEQIPGGLKIARARSGRTLLRRGQLEDAALLYRQALEDGDSSRDVLIGLADALDRNGDTEAALTALEQELRLRPWDGEAWATLVELAAKSGRSPDEIGSMVAGLPMPGEPAILAQRAAYLEGACLREAGSEESELALRRALSGPDPRTRALAGELVQEVETGGAGASRLSAARILLAQGLTGPALAAVDGLEVEPGLAAEALVVKGYGLMRLGRLEEAEETLRRAMELAPDSKLGQFAMGSLLRVKGDAEGAADLLVLAVKQEPPNPAVYAELGNALIDLGDYGDAERALRLAVEAAPTDADLRLAVARFYVDSQFRAAEALDDAREAVRLSGRSADALATLGWGLQLSGQPEEALQMLGEAEAKAPESAQLRYRLGSVYESLMRFDEARDEYQLVLELDGTGNMARRAQAALDSLGERQEIPESEQATG